MKSPGWGALCISVGIVSPVTDQVVDSGGEYVFEGENGPPIDANRCRPEFGVFALERVRHEPLCRSFLLVSQMYSGAQAWCSESKCLDSRVETLESMRNVRN